MSKGRRSWQRKEDNDSNREGRNEGRNRGRVKVRVERGLKSKGRWVKVVVTHQLVASDENVKRRVFLE